MSFIKTQAEIDKLKGFLCRFYDAEVVSVLWETSPDIMAKLLPPPLKPAPDPLVWAFVANYPRTNFGVTYREAALSLAAEFNGELGFHCIAMPVTDDIAMIGGREWYGYPKKIANISLKCEGSSVEGWVERHNTRFFYISAKLGAQPNSTDAMAIIGKYTAALGKIFLFKYFGAPEDPLHFDYNPRLIREEIGSDVKEMEPGAAEVVLTPAANDPWAEVKVVRMIGAVYMKADTVMKPGKVVAEVDPVKFLPYAFMKSDFNFEASPPPSEKRARPRREKVVKTQTTT